MKRKAPRVTLTPVERLFARRIVDEPVDRDPRIGADGEGRPVEQQDLELARRGRSSPRR